MSDEAAAKGRALAAGHLLGPYEIVDRLGRGGMGEVYLARDTRLGRRVALKVLPEDFAEDRERLERFRREARIASALEHPNIVTVYDVGESGALQYIVTEYVDGKPLSRRLRSGPLALIEAIEIAAAVAAALGAAHAAGIVHRDVKPANVMLRGDGLVKVLDFGIAKRIGPAQPETPMPSDDTYATVPGMMLGTVRYASPEQAQGLEVDGRTDIWSLGVMLYEMIAGVRPFEGPTTYHVLVGVIERDPEPLSRLREGVPGALERVVGRALAKRPDARYPRAEELLGDLRRLAAALPVDGDAGRTEPTWVGATVGSDSEAEAVLARTDTAALGATVVGGLAPNNLPEPVTSFVGRAAQIWEVAERLKSARLVTLTGPGGIGKTRLALEVGRRATAGGADEVWVVELAGLMDPEFVPATVAKALEVHPEPGVAPVDALAARLGARRVLLLLDNCEHLVDACARLVAALLGACPQLHVLATSREPLGITGEAVWPLPTLTIPEAGGPLSAETVTGYEATRLFAERAALSRPAFAVTDGNAAALVQVCRRLDGIPLAIELAAARVRVLSVAEIAAKLDDCFQLLTGGSRTAPRRQQTLRAAIDWSHDLLSERERVLLRRLSVFVGGFTLAAAEAVAGPDLDGGGPADVLDPLVRLVDGSLVLAEESDSVVRYRMYETIARYAAERLAEAGEEAPLRERHRDWYLALAEEAEPELTGPRQFEWVTLLEREHDNLNAALRWSVEEAVDPEAGLRLCRALGRFWSMHAHLAEGRSWLERVLAMAPDRSNPLRPRVLLWAAQMARLQGDLAAAEARLVESLETARALGDTLGSAAALSELFTVAYYGGDVERAEGFARESLELFREVGDARGASLALAQLGNVASERGDFDRASEWYEESLELIRGVGDRRSLSTLLNNLGRMAGLRGEHERGYALIQEGLAIVRDLGDKTSFGYFLHSLGLVATHAGDHDLALRYNVEALLAHREVESGPNMAELLESIAGVEVNRGDAARAARLLGAAARLRDEIGVPVRPDDAAQIDADLEAARRALGSDGLELALAEGRAMTRDMAVAYAVTGRA